MRVGTSAALHRAVPNPVDYVSLSFQYIIIHEPNYLVAQRSEVRVSFGVLSAFVRRPVHFDDQFRLGAIEVHDEEVDDVLSPELQTVHFA